MKLPVGQIHAAPPALLVVHVFPTFAVGGAQIRFAALANHFGSAFRHLIVAMDNNLGCRDRLDSGLDVGFPVMPASKNATLPNLWRFQLLLREWQPDVLVTCNWGAIEFALANLVPRARHIHMVDGFGPEEHTVQIRRRILARRIALRRATVVLPSRNLVRIARDIWRLPPEHLRYIPNAIDLGRFTTENPRHGGADLVIGTVAALRQEKNIARLLRAFAGLPFGRLVIVGDGPEQRSLQALTASLDISDRVTFAGQQTNTAEFYARFDIFALSSDTEQMPLAVIEAMASGLPVVSTAVGDVQLMVASANVPFVTKLDDAAFIEALSTLASDPALRARVGAANLEKAQRDFDHPAMFAAHGALWRG